MIWVPLSVPAARNNTPDCQIPNKFTASTGQEWGARGVEKLTHGSRGGGGWVYDLCLKFRLKSEERAWDTKGIREGIR
jgi:hypothetical protein